ncbi:hypothetical protein OUZ56_015669 [Daphnia magna]|uniref:Uncharacterized protein n=1 Tax=Daphnia magna TaxID=35525 RepID=A0ABR0ANE4_9CRUS|nr:hypothetical protein OUZ56_015669 [Daphnia magna]
MKLVVAGFAVDKQGKDFFTKVDRIFIPNPTLSCTTVILHKTQDECRKCQMWDMEKESKDSLQVTKFNMVIKLPPLCIVLYSFYPKTMCQLTYLPGCNEEESLIISEELTCLSGCNEEEPLESKLLNGEKLNYLPGCRKLLKECSGVRDTT